MVEIMTSVNFDVAVRALGLRSAHEVYRYKPTEKSYWPDPFSVWEIDDSGFRLLATAFTEDEWHEKFPGQWWRYSEGTNLDDDPDFYRHSFSINGKHCLAWADKYNGKPMFEEEENGQLYIKERDYSYRNPLEYCVQEIGTSTPKNIDAVCHGIARINHMSLATFFAIYMEEQ